VQTWRPWGMVREKSQGRTKDGGYAHKIQSDGHKYSIPSYLAIAKAAVLMPGLEDEVREIQCMCCAL
jgi:hypothetical protein